MTGIRLTSAAAGGYRAFGERIDLPLPGVSIVFGANNSGKTALARLPFFAMASFTREDFLALGYRGILFAPDFRSLANLDEAHPGLSYELEWTAPSGSHSARVELQLVSSADLEERVVPLAVVLDDELVHQVELDSRGPWPELAQIPQLTLAQAEIREILSGTLHIPSARPAVGAVYHWRAPSDPLSLTYDDAPFALASNPSLLEAVSHWYQEALGHGIAIEQAGFAFRIVTESNRGAVVNMSAAGRGSQAVLPVVTLLKAVELGLAPVRQVVVEEPEAHLHPSAHAAIGDLLLGASSHGATIVVETHSPGVILRLRRRVAEGQTASSELALAHVDPGRQPACLLVPIETTGAVPEWPPGVFEYELPEIDVLAEKMFES